MKTKVLSQDRFTKMTETPIQKLIVELAIPPMITMLVTSVYNMADTFFVSQIGTSASGAVGVVFSLMAAIQAIGFTLGMGAGTYLSRLLGEKNGLAASQAASTAFFTALMAGLLLAAGGLYSMDPLLRLLGATPTILPYARDYAQYILIGAPYMMASFVMNNVLRAQGNAFFGMIGIGIGAVINIMLDPIFIFTLDLGIGGAALATIVSQLISFFVLLYICTKDRGGAQIGFRFFSFKGGLYYQILRNGMPSFYRQGLASVATLCLNFAAAPFGDGAIAAMSIVARLSHFMASGMLGFGQGYMPVCGFNYGAKRYDRVWSGFWFSLKVSVLFFAILGLGGFLLAQPILTAFRREDWVVIAIGTTALRLQCVCLPLQAWIIMTNMLTQSIGKAWQASLLSICRQGLFFLPAILWLPGSLAVLGIQLAQPMADIASCLLAIPLVWPVLRQLRQDSLQISPAIAEDWVRSDLG